MFTLLQLALTFGYLSLLAIGGGISTLTEMQRLSVEHFHWLSASQFRDAYSLGQITPGPAMLMVTAIGYQAAGIPGAIVATIAMFLPTSILIAYIGKHWDKFATSPWRIALQKGLAPVTIGLMLAGILTLAQSAVFNTVTAIIAMFAAVIIFRFKISPALVVLAGGIIGLLLLN